MLFIIVLYVYTYTYTYVYSSLYSFDPLDTMHDPNSKSNEERPEPIIYLR